MTPPRTVSVTSNVPGTALAKFLICLAKSNGLGLGAAEFAAKYCRQTPVVEHIFSNPVTDVKAAVAGASTSAAGFMAEQCQYGLAAENFLLLQSRSLLGILSPKFRHVPFRVKCAREVGGGAGGNWRGEGLPLPSSRTTTDTFTSEFREAAVLLIASREVFEFGLVPERTLRDLVLNAVDRFLAAQLVDPSVSATTSRPASLTSGATSVTSSGSSAANIVTDLSAMIALIETPGDGLTWVMKPVTFATIAAKLGGVGLTVTRDNLFGIPVAVSSASPSQIALIDCSAVAFASDGEMVVDVSRAASIQMDDSPSQSALSGTGASLTSMFQTQALAVRATLGVDWQHLFFAAGSPTRPQGAAVMTVSY